MKWQLVRELGVDLDDASRLDTTSRELLRFPTCATQATDGTYLIVEERGTEKQVPFRFECRSIRVDANRKILFDTATCGIEDGHGCLVGDGYLAILRRTKWELLIVSPEGNIAHRLGLEHFSKKMPRYVTWTCNGTFLVVFYNRSHDLDIVEIDRQGHLLWYLPPGAASIGIAASTQLLPAGTLLVADPFRHVVTEIDRRGNVVWQFGEEDHPACDAFHLSNPNSVRCLADGQRLVADTRNHRILSVALNGTAVEVDIGEVSLCDPTYVDRLPNGHYLICDTGNARILELDESGNTVWHYGKTAVRQRTLSYPRSVDKIGPDKFLVADTGHNQIVELYHGTVKERQLQGEQALFWPRCVRLLASGSLLVADGRNGRIIEMSAEGQLLRQLAKIQFDGEVELCDPHDVRMLPNGHLLISDSAQDLVLEVDWSGRVFQVFGAGHGVELKDPHSAQQLEDGSVVISDTGQHRILVVGPDGKQIREIRAIHGDSTCFRLHHPRYAEVGAEGTLVIADTGQNRILGATLRGQFLWEFSQVPDSSLPRLNQPRWATLVEPNELLVCDHLHHRILHVKRTTDRDKAR